MINTVARESITPIRKLISYILVTHMSWI